jgi:hypothetical protein
LLILLIIALALSRSITSTGGYSGSFAAEGFGGPVFSFPLCEFFDDRRIYRSHGRGCRAGISALIIHYIWHHFQIT